MIYERISNDDASVCDILKTFANNGVIATCSAEYRILLNFNKPSDNDFTLKKEITDDAKKFDRTHLSAKDIEKESAMIEYSISRDAKETIKMQLKTNPLKKDSEITVHDGSNHYIEISSKDFFSFGTISLWGSPYGTTAMKSKASSVFDPAEGLLVLDLSMAEIKGRTIIFNIIFIKSVIEFVVSNHQKALANPEFIYLRSEVSYYNKQKLENKDCDSYGEIDKNCMALADDNEYLYGHLMHANEGGITKQLQEWFFDGGGDYDYKPIIRPIWGARQRYGNKVHTYYFDTWANIYYGFMGKWVGFDKNTLIERANVFQNIDNMTGWIPGSKPTYDPSDDIIASEGYDMIDFNYNEIIKLLDDTDNLNVITLEARDKIWGMKIEELKIFSNKELKKRGLPLWQ